MPLRQPLRVPLQRGVVQNGSGMGIAGQGSQTQRIGIRRGIKLVVGVAVQQVQAYGVVAAELGTEFGIRTGGGEAVGIGVEAEGRWIGNHADTRGFLARNAQAVAQHAAAAAHRGAELLLAIRTSAQAGISLHRGAGLTGKDLNHAAHGIWAIQRGRGSA